MTENPTRDYDVLTFEDAVPFDRPAVLHVQLTHEGIIADLIVDGEVVDTWARTAQEMVDREVL